MGSRPTDAPGPPLAGRPFARPDARDDLAGAGRVEAWRGGVALDTPHRRSPDGAAVALRERGLGGIPPDADRADAPLDAAGPRRRVSIGRAGVSRPGRARSPA